MIKSVVCPTCKNLIVSYYPYYVSYCTKCEYKGHITHKYNDGKPISFVLGDMHDTIDQLAEDFKIIKSNLYARHGVHFDIKYDVKQNGIMVEVTVLFVSQLPMRF